MQTEYAKYRINYVTLANRVRDLKKRSMSEAGVSFTDDQHFGIAFNQAMNELRELNPLIKRLNQSEIKKIKSRVGHELASRPRRTHKQSALDLSGFCVVSESLNFVEVQDRATNRYSFSRVGRKIVCTASSAGFRISCEMKKFVREYFAAHPVLKQSREKKKKRPVYPLIEYKTSEIIVQVDAHFAGKYKKGKRFPVLVSWLKDDTKVEAADVPLDLRELARGFARICEMEKQTRQKPMFRLRM